MTEHKELIGHQVRGDAEDLPRFRGFVSAYDAGSQAQVLCLQGHLHQGKAAIYPAVIRRDIRVFGRSVLVEADKDCSLSVVAAFAACIHFRKLLIALGYDEAPGLVVACGRGDTPGFQDVPQVASRHLLVCEATT